MWNYTLFWYSLLLNSRLSNLHLFISPLNRIQLQTFSRSASTRSAKTDRKRFFSRNFVVISLKIWFPFEMNIFTAQNNNNTIFLWKIHVISFTHLLWALFTKISWSIENWQNKWHSEWRWVHYLAFTKGLRLSMAIWFWFHCCRKKSIAIEFLIRSYYKAKYCCCQLCIWRFQPSRNISLKAIGRLKSSGANVTKMKCSNKWIWIVVVISNSVLISNWRALCGGTWGNLLIN